MKLKPVIYPYKMYSEAANSLRQSLSDLGCKLIRSNGNYVYRNRHIIVNYGASNWGNWNICINTVRGRNNSIINVCDIFDPNRHTVRILNNPKAVSIASDKLLSFQAMQKAGINIPKFTTNYSEAVEWASKKTVVARSVLRGSGGKGIIIYEPKSALPEPHVNNDKLWVQYIKKIAEYRIHVFNGKVLFVQQKKKKSGVEDRNNQIRNHDNGWVFCRENVSVPEVVNELAINAVKSLGLDFGAVDMIYNRHEDRYYVLEVNTAPGLEGKSIEDYSNAIREYCNEV